MLIQESIYFLGIYELRKTPKEIHTH